MYSDGIFHHLKWDRIFETGLYIQTKFSEINEIYFIDLLSSDCKSHFQQSKDEHIIF